MRAEFGMRATRDAIRSGVPLCHGLSVDRKMSAAISERASVDST